MMIFKEYYLDFLEPKLDTNSKFLFSHIKHMKNDSVGIEAISHKGSITTDPKTIAEAFADQYESVFCKENLDNIPSIMPSPYPDMEDFEISESGVLSELQGLNVHKSVGPDGLSPHLLRMLATQISPTLTKIFRSL